MSQDVAVFAKGTILKLGDGVTTPSEGFTEIKGITKFGVDPGGAGDPDKIDVTSGSTSGLVREKIDGYSDKRPGTVDFDLLCDLANTNHSALEVAARTGTSKHFQIVVKTSTATKTAGFTARVSGFPLDIPHDKVVGVKAKLAITEGTWLWAT